MLNTKASMILAGVTPEERRQASAPTNLHMVTGVVNGKSASGKTQVLVDGLVINADDSQYLEIDTLGGLEDGDTVTIILSGESGHGMHPLAIGSVGSIDRIDVRIGQIEADYVKATLLEAEVANIGFLKASDAALEYATITNLTAATGRIGTLEANTADIATIRANSAKVANLTAEELEADHATVGALDTTYATITNLNAATGRIDDLEADHVTVSDFEAEQGKITALQTNTADIATIRANSAKVANLTAAQLEAANAYISSLTAGNVTAQDIIADTAKVHSLTAAQLSAATAYIASLTASNVTAANLIADHGTIGSLDSNYAQINMANVNNGWITNGTIKNGAIGNAMISDVSANKLTAGTIDASNITVTNLNADNITTGTINGQRIGEGSLSLSKLEEDVYTESEIDGMLSSMQAEIDGAIETWTGTAVPTLQNAPAVNWTTNAIKDTHVGDVYFVVNSNSQQNGYNYRFTKSGSSYSWQLIKDTDITNALSRLSTAEGQIAQFDSDISTLQTDTGTLTTRTSSLETRMTTAEGDIADKVDTTTFNEVSNTVDSHSQTISQHTTAIASKADSSTVTSLTTRVSKNEQDISGINTTIGSLQTTVESKADGTTVSTLTSQVNSISDTVDGHTSSISSITSTQTTMQTTLNKTVKSSIQLWYTKANTTAPSAPTSKITSTSTSGNAWRTVVPAYNVSYPNYYYCWQYEYVDGTYGWSTVIRDIAMGESQSTSRTAASDASSAVTTANTAASDASSAVSTANTASSNASAALSAAQTADSNASTALSTANTAASDASSAVSTANTASSNASTALSTANTANSTANSAQATANANIKSSVQLWFTKSDTTAPSKPTAQVTTSNANTANAWNLIVPTWNSSYPYYYYCYQQQKGDGTWQWSDVVYDRATSEAQQLANTVNTNLSTLQTDYATFKQTTQQFESTIGNTYATKTEVTPAKNYVANATANYGYQYKKNITVYGDSDKYYPVYFTCVNFAQTVTHHVMIMRGYAEKAPADWNTNTHRGGLNLHFGWNFGGWGGAQYKCEIYEFTQHYSTMLGDILVGQDGGMFSIVFLRGGGETGALYHVYSDVPFTRHNYMANTGLIGADEIPYPGISSGTRYAESGSYSWNIRQPLTTPNTTHLTELYTVGRLADAASRLTTAETSITQNQTNIALKANASDVYTKTQTDGLISTEVTNRNSAIEQSASAIQLSVSQTYTTKTEFANLDYDNTNLIRNSNSMPLGTSDSLKGIWRTAGGSYGMTKKRIEINDGPHGSCGAFKLVGTHTSVSDTTCFGMDNFTFPDVSEIYEMSLYARVIEGSGFAGILGRSYGKTIVDVGNTTDILGSYYLAELTSSWKRIWIRFKISSISNNLYIGGIGTDAIVQICNVRLERANATEKALTAAKAEIKVTTDGITSTVSQKTDKSAIISTINQSAETVKIQASKVEIDGTAVFNSISSSIDNAITSKGYATTTEAQGYASTAAGTVNAALSNYITSNDAALQSIQNQVDGQIEAWYKTVDPTTSNEPASTWTTDALKQRHEGDLYYNVTNGHSWRWLNSSGTYSWQQIPDSDASAALAAAQNAQTTANSKRRIFTSTPTVPYDVGDLWVSGTQVKYATASKTSSQSYSASDWTVTATDDSNIPTNVSQLTNDANYGTTSQIATAKSEAISAAASDATAKANAAETNAKNYADSTRSWYATCDTAAATTAKVATIDPATTEFALSTGTVVFVKFSIKNTGAVGSLTLNVNNTGAKNIKYINNNAYANIPGTDYLQANVTYQFVYDGTYWVIQNLNYNTDAYTARDSQWYNTIVAGEYLYNASMISGRSDGKFYGIKENSSFDLAYPLLWLTTNISSGGTNYANIYTQCYDRNLANYYTSFSNTTNNCLVYLVGTVSGNTFSTYGANSNAYLTTTVPTTEDGLVYIPIGHLGNPSTGKNYFNFEPGHPVTLYAYLDGKFRQVTPTEIVSTHRIYYRTATANSSLAAPTTWVEEATGNVYNAWTTKVPPLAASTDENATKYLYLYTCEQRKRLDGTIQCTKVLLDENTTVIDGGQIITNSVTANQIAASTITSEELAASSITADRLESNVLTLGSIDGLEDRLSELAGDISSISSNTQWVNFVPSVGTVFGEEGSANNVTVKADGVYFNTEGGEAAKASAGVFYSNEMQATISISTPILTLGNWAITQSGTSFAIEYIGS